MHTYRKLTDGYSVGYWNTGTNNSGHHSSFWHELRLLTHLYDAAAYVNYLNGGSGKLLHEWPG